MPIKHTIQTQVQPRNPVPEEEEDRDPKGLNKHVTVKFPDVFGEPAGARSFDCIWEFAPIFYDCCREFLYNVLVILYGPCIALSIGCQFGLEAFEQIWICTPFVKAVGICCMGTQRFLKPCVRCCIYPPCRAISHLFVACKRGDINFDKYDDPFYGQQSTVVKKTRIVQTPKRKGKVEHGENPPPTTPEPKKEDKTVPVAAPVPTPKPKEDDPYFGDGDKIKKSVQRQMML